MYNMTDTGHWPLVPWDDPNLFTDNSKKTSKIDQVLVSLCMEGDVIKEAGKSGRLDSHGRDGMSRGSDGAQSLCQD